MTKMLTPYLIILVTYIFNICITGEYGETSLVSAFLYSQVNQNFQVSDN